MNYPKLPAELRNLFAPLQETAAFVIGQLGQSLDGRIATETGDSKYISGKDGLLHLHRLRSFCDAVVVGVGTVIADNPQLNLRLCGGKNPARVIIDPRGRLSPNALALKDDGIRCIVITTSKSRILFEKHVERLEFEVESSFISPQQIVQALSDRGLNKLLIEGGAYTVSHFLSAGVLDRLHVIVSPIIIGSGKSGLSLPPIDLLSTALRPEAQSYKVGKDIIFDCKFK